MAVRIVPYTCGEMAEVAAFNARLAAAHPPDGFPLPAVPTADPLDQTDPVRWSHLLAVDDQAHVRGGFLQMDQCAWLQGRPVSATNYQSPVSEGIWDSQYAMVGMQMLRAFQQRARFAFIVGMGHADKPLPRLLTATGWTVRPVPFQFHMVRAGRVLRELSILQRRPLSRIAAQLAARTGTAWVGNTAWLARSARARFGTRGYVAEPMREWGRWTDAIWERARTGLSFAVTRTQAVLDLLYPPGDSRYLILRVSQGGQPCGWIVGLRTAMHEHKDFGNLIVGTVLDALAIPGAEVATAVLAARALAQRGADLVITNQSHTRWREAFADAGFLAGPSNFLLATSRPLTDAIGSDGADRVHVVRGDGDGRIHL